MRVLLYKDWCMLRRNYKLMLVWMVVLAVVTGVDSGTAYYAMCPAILMSAMAINCLAYDEKSGWMGYAEALPYGRKKLVGSKYVLTLLIVLSVAVLVSLSMLISGGIGGWLRLRKLAALLEVLFVMETLYMGLMLPVCFRFGTERGRWVYVILVIVIFTGVYMVVDPSAAIPDLAYILSVPAMIVIWGVSYFASLRLYRVH